MQNQDEFTQDFKPSLQFIKARELAVKYHYECETFDRTVCTGRVVRGSILPADARELGLINMHAKNVLRLIMREAEDYGICRADMVRAIATTEQ